MSGWGAGGACLRREARESGDDVWVGGHRPQSIDEASQYPLFTDEVIALMRASLPPEQHDHVATSVIVKARKPE